MESSGLKASFSAVINGDKIDYGVHYEDTDGVSINYEDSCLMDDVEDEANRVIFKAVSDYMTQRKQLKQKTNEKTVKVHSDGSITANEITTSVTSQLQEENKRLNDKIAELEGRLAKMEKSDAVLQGPEVETQENKRVPFHDEAIENMLRLFGYIK